MDEIALVNQAQALKGTLSRWRRDFHRHPELGFQEHRTADVVARELSRLGLEVRTGIAGTGIAAVLAGQRPGPTVLLRFDMDALPIEEQTGASYASQTPGVMHACGHDGHLAIGLGVAHILQDRRQAMAGRILFVFQPAEEGLGGASRMIEEGVLKDPVPSASLAVHLWNQHPLGWIGLTPGPAMAGAEILEIEVTGRGSHGALPHQAADPVLAAAQLVTALQSVVARNVNPLSPAVVSITQVSAGDAFNVIPPQAKLRGTIRTFEPEVRIMVLERVEEVARGVAQALGCQANVRIEPATPAVVNDPLLTRRLQNLAARLFPDAIVETGERSMVSEDMAFFLRAAPGCMMLVGSANPGRGLDAAHHNPRFDFDEAALPRAAGLMACAAWELLEHP
jgi:amidohydrolase